MKLLTITFLAAVTVAPSDTLSVVHYDVLRRIHGRGQFFFSDFQIAFRYRLTVENDFRIVSIMATFLMKNQIKLFR